MRKERVREERRREERRREERRRGLGLDWIGGEWRGWWGPGCLGGLLRLWRLWALGGRAVGRCGGQGVGAGEVGAAWRRPPLSGGGGGGFGRGRGRARRRGRGRGLGLGLGLLRPRGGTCSSARAGSR